MLTTIRYALLTATLTATLATRAAHADQSPACDHAALVRAEREAVAAEGRYAKATTWSQQNRALALVAAAMEQVRTARALCTPSQPDALGNPFEADPFDATTEPVPAWTPPVEVPGIPYLVADDVEARCPGIDCPVVWAAGTVTP